MIVLNFHGIGTPHAGVDAAERKYWFARDEFAEILQRIADCVPPPAIAFTFDDGNRSDLEAAAMLAERGMQARFFLLTGRFRQREYCSPTDARTLLEMGMQVGLHGRDHVDWRLLDDAGLRREIVDARAQLADALGAEVDDVAIPFGAYDRRVLRVLGAQGFARIHTSDGGACSPHARIQPRNTLHRDMAEAEIDALLAGRFAPQRRLRAAVRRVLRGT